MRRELNVLALHKGAEHYIYVFDDAGLELLLQEFAAQAGNDRLTLNWFDAAILAQKARAQVDVGERAA